MSNSVLVIHDYPLPLEGSRTAGALLLRTLAAFGVEKFDVTSVVAEKMSGDELGKLKAKGWNLETDRLREEAGPFDKILFLGALPVAAYFGLPKAPKISQIRGRGMMTAAGEYAMATWAPRQCFKDADWFRDFAYDIQKLADNTAPLPIPMPRIHMATDAVKLYGLFFDAPFISADIETTGLVSAGTDILSVGFSLPNGTSAVVEGAPPWLREFLEGYDGVMAFHNLKFDYRHLSLAYPGLELRNPSDTMLASYLHDERGGKYKPHGLKGLARTRYDADDYGIDMKKFLEEWKRPETTGRDRSVMRDDLYLYQAIDTTYTAKLYEDLTDELEVESPALVALLNEVYVPAAVAFSNIERRGVPIDRGFFEQKLESLTTSIDEQLLELTGMAFALTGKEEFKPGSPKELRKVLYEDLGLPIIESKNDWKRKTDDPSTEKEVLKTLARDVRKDRPEVAGMIDTLLAWRKDAKLNATYVQGILKRLDVDDRLRCEYRLHGTETGRVSCAAPNLQNIPAEIMEGFVADRGWTLIVADYSQLELRVAAVLSGDKTLVKTFEEDGDVHQEVAFALWGKAKEDVTKAERVLAKTVSFGSIYGLSPQGLAKSEVMSNLAEKGEQVWSENQIRTFQRAFERKFSGLYVWIREQKALGKRQKYVENLLGFRRRFPLILPWDVGTIERQAVNTPIQGLAGQMTTIAVSRMDQQFNEEYAQVLLTVHDSILVMCRDDVVEDVRERMHLIMEDEVPELVKAKGGYRAWVPFKIEIGTGQTWKEAAK